MIALTKDNFKSEVLDSPKPVLVDFWSTTCGPCRALEPKLKALEPQHPDVKFAKIEAQEALEVFGEYRVGRVPTLILFKDGKEVERTGFLPEGELRELLKKAVKPLDKA